MSISVFDLFKIGIGPSSSHTVGPMKAAREFAQALQAQGLRAATARVRCELYGSLAATGKGHGSDTAMMLGLLGETPEHVDPDAVPALLQEVRAHRQLALPGGPPIRFDERDDLAFLRRESLPFHPNGMRFTAYDTTQHPLLSKTCYSVGGGFVVDHESTVGPAPHHTGPQPPYPFHSGAELMALCEQHRLSMAEVMAHNERACRPDADLRAGLLRLWEAMQSCVRRGMASEGVLPGAFQVRRRAAALHRQLCANAEAAQRDPLQVLDWVNLYALAVNEENAAGGRVVTAPTNGAAGIVPAVLHYYTRFVPGANEQGVIDFLLTAGAIGLLYKENASISGAEVGCQGEVGVACSMAAGALCAVLGGTPRQVENAAEIGMEHHLGLTCDPVGGLVQIPCIERNAIASVQAINAARMALHGDGTHRVSLDKVIKTMRETGADMKLKYKETSRGGLAVNVIEC